MEDKLSKLSITHVVRMDTIAWLSLGIGPGSITEKLIVGQVCSTHAIKSINNFILFNTSLISNLVDQICHVRVDKCNVDEGIILSVINGRLVAVDGYASHKSDVLNR